MSKTKWSPDKTLKFVIEYRNRECLWNTTSPSYKDRRLKQNAYLELSEMFECDGVNDVKIKIKNLRTTYIQEFKKVQESIKTNSNSKGDGVYVPSLVWYKEMDLFLRYSGVGKMMPIVTFDDAVEVIHIKEEAIEMCPEDIEVSSIPDPPLSLQYHEPKQNKEHVPQTTKKRKFDSQTNNMQHTAATDNFNNDPYEEHEFDIFGKSVAKQLKSFFSIAAALRVQSRIQTLLTEERIKDQIAASHANSLRRNSSTNPRFFYNHQESPDFHWPDATPSETEIISVMVPSRSTDDISNLANDSHNSNPLLIDQEF